MDVNGTVPTNVDHGNTQSEQNVPSLGDILKASPMFDKLMGNSTEEDKVPAPEDLSGHDENDVPNPDNGDGIANDDDGDVPNPDEDDSNGDDSKGSLPTDDDIDWEYKVPVKIDGKVEYFTLEQLRKGYATEQSLSAKGRELGDERKQLEAERNEKLKELVDLGSVLHGQLEDTEKSLAAQYHSTREKMEEAIENGDGYEAKELKKQVAEAQEKYWSARTKREELQKQVGKQVEEANARQQQQLLQYFQQGIKEVLPEFNDELAVKVREFALAEGIPEDLLGSLYEPKAIKFINDYRLLKERASKGAVKREQNASKTIPTKRGTPERVKQNKAQADLRGKVLLGEADNSEQLAFLKNISSISNKFK